MDPSFTDKILSYEEWKERTHKARPSLFELMQTKDQNIEPKFVHDPRDEPKPDHLFFAMDTKDMDKKIEEMFDRLLGTLRSAKFEEIEEIAELIEKILQSRTGPKKHEWLYALVGDHGNGKSTTNNALLGRYNLASVSGGPKSCTQHATRYEYLEGAADDTRESNVTIKFFDKEERERITREHIMRYALVYDEYEEEEKERDDKSNHSPSSRQVITEGDRSLARDAFRFFRIIVKGNKGDEKALEAYLNSSKSFIDDSLLEFCLWKQEERLEALKVNDKNTVTYLNVPDRLDPQEERGEKDIAAVRKIAETLAPLVDLVIVATGSMLLRYGIVLLDIPGKLPL
ncbi:hypothetical protein N0V90_013061 [Kalmusia sp. IMI 367209]|nr:hypothetical protein N0V90_013061 [Kalmusia sp. IMI 367209]